MPDGVSATRASDPADAREAGQGLALRVGVGALLLLSGAAALLHETVWFRVLTPVLGAGALTAGVVSAGALLGLALGAAWGGRRAARSRRPLLLVAGAELLAAALCAAVPAGAAVLLDAVTAAGAESPALAHLGALLLSTLLTALAALPLGVTLPCALAALAPARGGAAARFRWLYGVNTLGAVLGVLLAAGFVLEWLGNRATAFSASGLQLGVAALALLLAVVPGRRRLALSWPERRAAGALLVPPAPRAPRGLFEAAFLAGGAGLAIQVAWVRRLTPAVGTTTQAFATVLAAHLLAIALGSLLLGPRARSRDRSVWVLLLAALPVVLLPAAIEPVAHWTSVRALELGGEAWTLLLTRALAAGMLLVPSTLLCAAALPWLLQRLRPEGAHAPQAAGRLLAWNTGGAALFALGTGAFWLPAVGSRAVLVGASGLLVLAAALLTVGRAARAGLVVLALALLTQPWLLPLEDAAGRDAVGASFLPAQFAIEDAPALFYAEGSATTVVVREREGHRELWVEGKIEASTQPTDRLHLTLLGALPMALHPDPQRVVIIGLGTGRTAQAVAAFGPRRLLLLEIEPEVLRTVGRFAADGGGLPAGAEVVIGDARHTLTRSAERFDVITSDPVHPGVAGSAALYATEMYALARQRLAPGGLFCQWLPLYQLTGDDMRLALRTFADSFEHPWVFLAGEDLVLVGGSEPLRVEEARLRERLAGGAGVPLTPLGLALPGRLLALVLKGPEGLRRFAGAGPRNSDDHLLLEFQAGRSWFVDDAFGNLTRLWPGRAKAAELLAEPASPAFRAEVLQAAAYWEGVRAWLGGEPARAAEAFGVLAAADLADRFAAEMRDTARLRAAVLRAQRGLLDEALSEVRVMAQEPGLTPGQRLDLAALLREWGAPDEGRALAEQVRRTHDGPRARRLSAP